MYTDESFVRKHKKKSKKISLQRDRSKEERYNNDVSRESSYIVTNDMSVGIKKREQREQPLIPSDDIDVSLVKIEVLNRSALPKPRKKQAN